MEEKEFAEEVKKMLQDEKLNRLKGLRENASKDEKELTEDGWMNTVRDHLDIVKGKGAPIEYSDGPKDSGGEPMCLVGNYKDGIEPRFRLRWTESGGVILRFDKTGKEHQIGKTCSEDTVLEALEWWLKRAIEHGSGGSEKQSGNT